MLRGNTCFDFHMVKFNLLHLEPATRVHHQQLVAVVTHGIHLLFVETVLGTREKQLNVCVYPFMTTLCKHDITCIYECCVMTCL